MRTTRVVSLLVLVLILVPFTRAIAQTGLRGTVTDSLSGGPLIGANVFLVGTSVGNSTDVEGRYRILGVKPGEYRVRVSSMGYGSKDFDVTITENGVQELDFTLAAVLIEGEEVVITAQMRGQVAAINTQLSSNALVNVVSADRIRELPDANAAESIGRLPGISLLRSAGEANRVVIRGLEPKLNTITVNGVKIPSTGANDRAVDLSMIASETLEGIEVFKATTPDMDASAVGGVVNLKIKKAPVERVIRIKGSPGYNQLVDSYGDYKFSVEYSDRFFDDVLGVVVTGNHEKVNRSSESFTGSYEVLGLRDTVTGVVPIGGTSIVVGNSLEDRTRSGASMTLDYDFGLGTVWLTNFYSLTSRNPFSTRKEYDPQNDLIRYTIRDQEIDLDGLSTALNGQISVWSLEMDWVVSRYRIVNDNSFDYTMTLDQGSSFDPAVLSVNDNTTYVPAARDSAHKLYLRGNIDEPNATTQTDYTAQYNIKVPFSIWYITGSVKAGGKYTSTDRDNRSSGYGALQYYLGGDFIARALPYYDKPVILTSSGQISSLNFLSDPNAAATVVDGRYRITPIYDRGIIKSWAVQQRPIYEFDRNALSENYDVKETVAGGYLMTELKYGTFATLLAGIRYELEDSWYKSVWTTAYEVYGRAGISFDTLTTRTNAYWFPHAHLKLQFTDWFDIRLSANRTLARPDFYWVSPWTRYDLTNARLYRGNPLLKDMKVANYNVSAFLYNNIFGFFGVSGFYKDIRDVFYAKRTQVYKLEDIIALGIPGREGGYEMRTYENAEKSEVRGVEVEWQTQLAFFPGIPEFLRGVVLNANYSRIWSKTLFPFYKFTATRIPGSRPPRFTYELSDFFREGPMPGQADEIINVSLGYDRGPFSARVSFSYQGPSINGVGEIAETDTWNQEFTRWDSTIKYRWTDWLALSLNLVNLSNQPDEAFFGSDRYQTSSFYYGMTGSASVEITL